MCFICRNRSVPPYLLFLILIPFARFVYAQLPTVDAPASWMLNRLQNHTYVFGESILRAILYRKVGYFNYACGFYCKANCEVPRYSLSVLLIAVHANITPTPPPDYFSPGVVWSANRENFVSDNATLELTDGGNLVLKDADKGSTVWSTGTSEERVAGINLTEIGNLVLFDQKGGIVWQSFDHPTDTLLDGQRLMLGKKLVAAPSDVNRTEQGRFSLTITIHGLDAVVGTNHQLSYYSFPLELSEDSYLTIREGRLDLLQNDSAAAEIEKTIVFINGVAATANYIRMHADGHLRAYGYDALGGSWMMGDMLPVKSCQYPTVCGRYGICSDGQCFCPSPTDGLTYFSPVNSHQPELGCSPDVPLTCEDLKAQSFLQMKNVTYFNFIVDIPRIDENGCRDACNRNCSCKAAFFRRDLNNSLGECFLPSELFSLIDAKGASDGVYNTVFIKVQNRRGDPGSADKMPSRKTKKTFLQKINRASIGVVIAFVLLISTVLLSVWRCMCSNEESEEEYVEEVSRMPIRFTYADLKYITDDFSQKLGEGGFGAVFKGTLHDGTMIAVKRLDDSRHMNKSFRSEVGTIGSIHHISLVKLLGFCAEKSHRLLVYEYMPNGSLDKWIFENSNGAPLSWEKRRAIILDVAKGLHYLHEQCKQKIVHLDIKPQNILLDENLRGKISDFGLSKLVERKDGQVLTTAVRGTPGYLAPEWLSGMITERVDVYSFGVVILEIILGKRVIDTSLGPKDMDLFKLLERKAEEGRLIDILEEYNDELTLEESVIIDALTVMRMACWCLQTDFRNRPSMSTVIKVLDGVADVKYDLVYDFAHPIFTRSEASVTVLSSSRLSGPR